MSTEIIDLTGLSGTPKKVRLVKGGPVYELPAEVPVEFYLKMKDRQKELSELSDDSDEAQDIDMIEELHQSALELFQIHQPNLKVIPVGVGRIFNLINSIYEVNDEASDDEPNPTKTRAQAGSKNTTRNRKAKR